MVKKPLATVALLGIAATSFAAVAVMRGPTAAEADHYVPDGQLIVREHRMRAVSSVDPDRHVSFLVVREVASGSVVVRRRFAHPRQADRIDSRLPPDAYRLSRFVRPCAAGCEELGARTQRCAARVTIAPGEAVGATVRTRAGAGCQVVVHPRRSR